MNRRPLRWLILVPTILTILAGFGSFAFYVDRLERSNLMMDIDDELVRAERSFELDVQQSSGRGPAAVQPDGANRPEQAPGNGPLDNEVTPPVELLINPDGSIIRSSGGTSPFGADIVATIAASSGTITVDEPRFRVRVGELRNGSITATALPLDGFDETVAGFRRAMLAGGLVILALVGTVLWLLTRVLVRPITRMAASATKIADGAYETVIDLSGGSQETATLASNLNRMMTQLRSTIAAREQAAADAAEARDDMQRFLADASHEMRTPLTALKGYADLYQGNMLDDPEALDRAMDRIGSESERLNGLVTDMLQLARQRTVAKPSIRLDISDIVQVVVDDLLAAHPDVDIGLRIDDVRDHTIMGVPEQLHQALLNVGSNACKFAPAGEAVEIAVNGTDQNVTITTADRGPGVSPDDAEKIFLPFYRPDTSRRRNGTGGAGLGLAITHEIVEQHNGSIKVTTTPGGGATFTISLPRTSQDG